MRGGGWGGRHEGWPLAHAFAASRATCSLRLVRLQRILDNLFGRKTAPGIYARSQARVMLFNVVNGTAALWHQHGFASVILPAELLAFSRATFAVMPPTPPRGCSPPFPAEMAEMVGQFLQFAAEVRGSG